LVFFIFIFLLLDLSAATVLSGRSYGDGITFQQYKREEERKKNQEKKKTKEKNNTQK
jgi:hypothetical protein